MHAPLYSTITLLAEIGISAIVFYTFYQGYKHNKFPTKLTAFALLYETIFNISYMAHRVPKSTTAKISDPATIALAAFHGILSLAMFVALVVFMLVAWRNYKKGHNFFAAHKKLTIVFLFFWSVSVISGIIFYSVLYIL